MNMVTMTNIVSYFICIMWLLLVEKVSFNHKEVIKVYIIKLYIKLIITIVIINNAYSYVLWF